MWKSLFQTGRTEENKQILQLTQNLIPVKMVFSCDFSDTVEPIE